MINFWKTRWTYVTPRQLLKQDRLLDKQGSQLSSLTRLMNCSDAGLKSWYHTSQFRPSVTPINPKSISIFRLTLSLSFPGLGYGAWCSWAGPYLTRTHTLIISTKHNAQVQRMIFFKEDFRVLDAGVTSLFLGER